MAKEKLVPLQLAQTLFTPTQINEVTKIMQSPLRQLMLLHMDEAESFGSACIAGEGNPNQTLFAIFYSLMERAEDPIKILQIFIKGYYYQARQ